MARLRNVLGLAGFALLMAWGASGARRMRALDLRGQVVLITGGSRGLGLCLARELANAGCKLAICARDVDELARAERDLALRGAEVLSLRCDVSDRDDAFRLVEAVLDHYGRLDGLINNAGIIQVGALDSMAIADFEQAMAVNFWGALYTSLAAIPAMRAQRGGWIANIDSIGGRLAVPHLLPYSVSKFALRGFSEGLTAEVAKDGIAVTTVLPGLMRTGSPTHVDFKGRPAGEFLWFATGDSTPVASESAPMAARQIVEAIRLGKREVTLGVPAVLAGFVHDALPGATIALLEQVNRLLPRYRGQPTAAVKGEALADTAVGPLVEGVDRLGERYNESTPISRGQRR